MTTLAESLSATDRILQTVGPLGFETNYPVPLLVGSECLIATRQMAKPGYQYQVLRAQNGTAPAGHAAGVSVATYSGGGSGGILVDNGSDPPAAVTTLVAPGADVSVAGEATLPLRFQLLGPYAFAFDSPNITSQFKLVDLAAGTIVVRAWAEVTTPFNGTASLQVGVGGPDWDEPDDDWGAVWQAAATSGAGGGNGYEFENSTTDPSLPRVARVTGAGALVISLATDVSTQGAGIAYAIIAVPTA